MAFTRGEVESLIKDKLNKKNNLSYIQIAEMSDYHPKYILKLKRDIVNGNFKKEHGNKERKPINIIDQAEEEKICNLYKRSNASIRKFCKFYGKRSYSCVYNVLKRNNLIGKS
jgi:hypothetical protein